MLWLPSVYHRIGILVNSSKNSRWQILRSLCKYSTVSDKVQHKTPARTRFAPSPTGSLHLGSLRTALFNYLLAKSTNGQFILRIEDTDSKRTIQESLESIETTLRWAQLIPDESSTVGGKYGPYIQSQRKDIYKDYVQKLLDSGHAYRCFCTPERLENVRNESRIAKASGTYDRKCLSISKEGSNIMAKNGTPYTVRLKSPMVPMTVHDVVFGTIQYRTDGEGYAEDPVLMKSDGMPTYHLANVVDDHLMEITHVVRGEEWLASTPHHLALYDAFGWEPPLFVHVPLLMDAEGHKLSKRKDSANVDAYIKEHFIPEALLNYLALYGWACPVRSEVLTLDRLVQLFSLEGLTKGRITVSPEKLHFLAKEHLQLKAQNPEFIDDACKIIQNDIKNRLGVDIDLVELKPILIECIPRMTVLSDFVTQNSFIFVEPTYVDEDIQTVITSLNGIDKGSIKNKKKK